MTVASISRDNKVSSADGPLPAGGPRIDGHRPPRILRALGSIAIGMLAYALLVGCWPLLFGVACSVSTVTCGGAFVGWFVAPVVAAAGVAVWAYRRTR